VNAIAPFLSRLQHGGKTVKMLEHLDVGAIGPETAKELAANGISCCLVPQRYQAEGILDEVTPDLMRGKRVLIPRAAEARADHAEAALEAAQAGANEKHGGAEGPAAIPNDRQR